MCFGKKDIVRMLHEEAPEVVVVEELADPENGFHVEVPLTLKERDQLDAI